MSEELLSLDIVMARRFALVEEITAIAGRHKAELKPFADELSLCEIFIKDMMNRSGLQQAKTGAGMAFFTTKDSVTVEDWEATLADIVANNNYGLLNRAVNKTAVKEYIEANKTPPPGVKYDSYRDLAWRRGKE
jgi:hypothetical protein